MPFAPTWMDLRDFHTKSDKERQILFIISMCNLENRTNQLIYKAETDSQTQKTNLQLLKGQRDGRDKLQVQD